MMRRIALALALLAATPVEAHCYSVWRYPWPQHCGVKRSPFASETKPLRFRSEAPFASRANVGQDGPMRANVGPEIALPGLARADLEEPEADEATRARLLLRAALRAPDGH